VGDLVVVVVDQPGAGLVLTQPVTVSLEAGQQCVESLRGALAEMPCTPADLGTLCEAADAQERD
jgi:hypothetical protein